jgi:FHA domain
MMAVTCPRGHSSATTDYCDQCGTPITGEAPGAGADAEISSATQIRVVADARGEPCPQCGTPRIPGDRYCEVDGYDFDDPAASVVWCAVVHADRERFEALHVDDLVFPEDAPTLTCALESDTVSVGRRSPSRGIFPDIDLGGAYEDPGVSREHLRFERTSSSATYAVVDCGSANGTTVNDDPTPITPHTPVPVADGDRIHLGGWTTITVQRA